MPNKNIFIILVCFSLLFVLFSISGVAVINCNNVNDCPNPRDSAAGGDCTYNPVDCVCDPFFECWFGNKGGECSYGGHCDFVPGFRCENDQLVYTYCADTGCITESMPVGVCQACHRQTGCGCEVDPSVGGCGEGQECDANGDCVDTAQPTGGGAPAPPSAPAPPQCNNVFQGYRECTGCSVSSEVWMNSCSGYNYQNPEADDACNGCDWCAAGQGSCPAGGTTTPNPPPATPSPQPGCAFGNVLAQVQKDITDAWKNSIVINPGESFNAGAFNDGTGQLIPDGQATITVSGPGGFSRTFLKSLETITDATAAGTYTVTVSATGCTNSVASVTVTAAVLTPPTSSKTKDVAKILLKYTEASSITSYTLFCDSYDKTLNYHNYAVQSVNVGSVLSNDAENVCVLKYGTESAQNVVFGTALKSVSNVQSSNLMKVLKEENCDAPGTSFKSCATNRKKAWLRNDGIVIYGKNDISQLQDPAADYLASVADFLRKLFALQPSATSAAFTFIEQASNLDRLYVSTSGSKRVTGVVDSVGGVQKISVEYSGFTTNPCSVINAYFNSVIIPAPSQPICTDLGNNVYVVKADCTGQNAYPQACNAWLDLTAKLRIQ